MIVLDKIAANSRKVHFFLMENYEDEDETQAIEEEDDDTQINDRIKSDTETTQSDLMTESEEVKGPFVQKNRVDDGGSLHFNIKKREESMRKKLNKTKLRNEIEEISIRDLFIQDAVKLSYEDRKAAKDSY